MYFVHPQIQLKNALKAKLSLIKPADPEKLKEKLSVYFPAKQLVFTDMARDAFKVIIEKMNLAGTTMMLPAYICDVFYPILKHYNITPIFLDIDLKTFHIKIEEIRNKITPAVKSILICHTYGLAFDINALRSELRERSDVIIIEDCAHNIFAGNSGDISFFSLYKQLPSLRGGMLVCPKDWRVDLPKTAFNLRDFLSFLNYFWPLAFFFKKFGQEFAKAHLRESKLTEPGGINRASLNLSADFFDSFKESLDHRIKLALLFQQELKILGFGIQESANNVFCYLSVIVPQNLIEKRDEIVQKLKKYHIFCTRIWHAPVVLDEKAYPNTFEAARRIINFPLQNHYKEKDIQKMIKAVKKVMMDIGYPSNGI